MRTILQHHPLTRSLSALLLLGLVLSGLGIILPARADGTSGSSSHDLAAPMVTYYPVASSAYLTNPGIGWQGGPGNATQMLPETVVYALREEISWKILNPSAGVYDWTALDTWLNKAKSAGQQLSFRVYTMRGESWGGHQVPAWVVSKGATITSTGAPDYSNCVYQSYWATFVEALRARYDGNPDIAFIDISGYSNFNEWSWDDSQTVFDTSVLDPSSLDGQARIRLADIYIGGSNSAHQCKSSSGATQTVSYSYTGFQKTQLVMPFAGVRQTTEYVASRRSDVGIRFDCLGSADDSSSFVMGKIGTQITATWRNAPIVFEMCGVTTEDQYMKEADTLMRAAHGSLVHDNLYDPRDASKVEKLMRLAGYRYMLSSITMATTAASGGSVAYEMHWQNVGYAPSYPRMGQRFALHVALVNSSGTVVNDQTTTATVSSWMPATILPGTPPDNVVTGTLTVPAGLASGSYTLRVGILDQRTGSQINLAFTGRDSLGLYSVGTVQVSGSGTVPVATATTKPAATATTVPSATATTKPAATATTVPSATAITKPSATAITKPSATPIPSSTLKPSATVRPSATPWPTVTPWPTTVPSVTPWPTVTPWPSPWPTVTPWPTNTPTSTPFPTATRMMPPTAWPTATPWVSTSVPNQPNPTSVPNQPQPTALPGQPTSQPPNGPQTGQLNHLGDVDASSQATGNQKWTATVTMRVHNAQEAPAVGVTITGTWSGEWGHWGNEEWASCVTDSSGQCSISRPDIRWNRSDITFNVLYVHIDGSTYNPSANHDPDNDWDRGWGRHGNTVRIVVRRP